MSLSGDVWSSCFLDVELSPSGGFEGVVVVSPGSAAVLPVSPPGVSLATEPPGGVEMDTDVMSVVGVVVAVTSPSMCLLVRVVVVVVSSRGAYGTCVVVGERQLRFRQRLSHLYGS